MKASSPRALESELVPWRRSPDLRDAAAIIVTVVARRGTFITFEGLDGCGKSTQLERLAGKLRESGFPVTVTREPGGTATGNKIRQLLLDTRTTHLDPLAALALMFASRT